MAEQALDIRALSEIYAAGTKPAEVIAECHGRIARDKCQAIWLDLRPQDQLVAQADVVARRRLAGETMPLFGIPFAVKDNIDVADRPTTAGCPAYRYVPVKTATVIRKLETAGAICLGKTNLDQFATGLTGTRSPYGVPSSAFDARYISGGSSSGSAVAVAKGLVGFSLGTDTAGSGRVPAACNNVVGLKPTRGWLSGMGVVPACRSLDCVSVLAGTVEDALVVAEIAAGFDSDDPFSRCKPGNIAPLPSDRFRFGVPEGPLEFFGDAEAARLFDYSIRRLEELGGIRVTVDFSPFRETGALLYHGPWIAERLAALRDFTESHSDAMLPVTREIIAGATRLSAVDAFDGIHKLAELARRTEAEWARMDILLLPTTGTTYQIADVLADPIHLNNNLGLYTNFANLLDLSAIAVPAGFRSNGIPFGVTLMARAFQDGDLAALATLLHHAFPGATVGATGMPLPHSAPHMACNAVKIAVFGAHLSGQPLNNELTERGAIRVRAVRTAPGYSLYALSRGPQARPGLVRDGVGAGRIEGETWAMSAESFGSFVAAIPPPLSVGTVALDDGSQVKGFLCEANAAAAAENITIFGGWRAYLEHAARRSA